MQDVEILESALKKSSRKIGIIAGISAALTLIVMTGLLFFCIWLFQSFQEQIRTSQQAQEAAKQLIVHPQFKADALKIATALKAEYDSQTRGWKVFESDHNALAKQMDELSNQATTIAERNIANALLLYEEGLYDCVDDAIGLSYPMGHLSDCQKQHPKSNIDDALSGKVD